MALASTFEDFTASSSNATIYTFSAHDLGTASDDRIIPVAVHAECAGGGTNSAVSSVTINAVSATARRQALLDETITEFWDALVPTGATGNIVVTNGEAQERCAIGVFTVTGADEIPTDTDGATGSGTSISITGLTVPVGGVGIAAWTSTDSAATTWTGATEDYDNTIETDTRASGARATTAGTNTIMSDGAAVDQLLIGIAYGPASGAASSSMFLFF